VGIKIKFDEECKINAHYNKCNSKFTIHPKTINKQPNICQHKRIMSTMSLHIPTHCAFDKVIEAFTALHTFGPS
jgi:hypothetical protein